MSVQTESPNVSIDRLACALKEFSDALPSISNMSVEEAAQYYANFRFIYDYLDDVRDKWASVKEELSVKILPGVFERSNVDQSITLKSGVRVTIAYKTTASMKDKECSMNWLRNDPMAKERHLENLIQPTVSASSLSSVARQLMEENTSLPPEYFTVTVKPTTSVTKAKK